MDTRARRRRGEYAIFHQDARGFHQSAWRRGCDGERDRRNGPPPDGGGSGSGAYVTTATALAGGLGSLLPLESVMEPVTIGCHQPHRRRREMDRQQQRIGV